MTADVINWLFLKIIIFNNINLFQSSVDKKIYCVNLTKSAVSRSECRCSIPCTGNFCLKSQ